MPLSRDQFKACCDLLSPQFNTTPDERRAFVTTALYGSPVLDKITWTGGASVFTTNLVRTVDEYDEPPDLVIDLLTTLRDSVGETKAAAIDALTADLAPAAPPPIPPPNAAPEASAPPPPSGAHIFISYSRRDLDFVDRLRADLSARNVPYWIDKEGLTPGTRNWEKALRRAIENSYAVVWVVSPDSLESDYVQDEIALAEVEQATLFPVWAGGEVWRKCVPLGKGHYQYIDMRGDKYTAGLDQLITALNGNAPELAVPPPEAPTLAPGQQRENPYMGLSAFKEDDVDKFFGREALTAQLAERLGRQLDAGDDRFLAVLGPSGAGKSSVVMAGLIPALKAGAIPGSDAWTYLPRIVPGTHPVEHLADALAPTLGQPLSHIEADLNAPGGRMLHRLARQLPGERAVLYIDQFEETFTLAADDGERLQFINLLTEAATEPGGKLLVLLSMRADFLDQPLNYPQLGKLFDRYNALVQPMAIHELRDAIEKPAHLPTAGLTFDAGLVSEIIFALRGRDKALAGALPLLQFTLERLYEERTDNRLTWDAYRAMGGVEGAIGTHSEAVFSQLPESTQNKLGQVFIQLVSIDESSGEPTRRRAPLDTITADPDAKIMVDAFVSPDARLLQTGSDGDHAYVEVAHEALLRSWTRLVDWIDITREDQLTIKRMERESALWAERGKPDHMLPNAESIGEFEAACTRLEREVTDPTLRDFIEPEQERLYRELEVITTTHQRRYDIGERLARIGDTREGIGIKDSLPDILWLPVAGSNGAHKFEFGEFEVKPFFIAKYLTTLVQIQAFLDSDWDNPRWWEGFPNDYQPQNFRNVTNGNTNAPRDTISWYQSVAFGRWMAAQFEGLALEHPSGAILRVGDNAEIRLPTEWEWQWAAMAGAEERKYPWGEWDEHPRANTTEAGINGRSTAVGMYPHGVAQCGALDMAGNLYEWCLNKNDPPEEMQVDDSGDGRVRRGGSFNRYSHSAAAAYRSYDSPNFAYYYYGLRLVCVLSAP